MNARCALPTAGETAVPIDIRQIIRDHQGRNYDLLREHVNPQFARVLRTIGFDRCYVRAEGAYLWDIEGRKYLDMLGGYAVFNFGRNHPDIRRAIIDALEADLPSWVQMEAPLLAGALAAELKKRIPYPLERVFFTNSGTEGIEAAIKFARCATGRPGIVHCEKGFHGLTLGALSLNGCESFRSGFEPFLPHCRQIPFDNLTALEAALSNRDVAAFIVEPIQGKGVNIPADGYLAEAMGLCREYGTLLVVDEVQTGVGRTGKFLATQWDEGCEPDMVVLSKALSGGYVPVGAVLLRRSIFDRVYSSMDRAIVHSSTFHEGAPAMAAALASLAALDDTDAMNNAIRIGAMIRDGVQAMIPRFEFLHAVRQRGLMIGIQFGKPRSLGLRTAWSLINRMDENLFPQAVTMPLLDRHRILTQVAGHRTNVVKLIPPLIISEDDAKWFLDAFEQVMADVHKFPGPVWGVLKDLGAMAVTHRARSETAPVKA